MPTTTPRLLLPRPSGSEPADGPDGFNDLTDALDTQVVVFAAGTTAARPDPGVVGRLFWNTDTRGMEYDDGAAWNPISPGEPPVGSLQMWPTAAPPNPRWLLCQGQAVSAATYAPLAGVLGSAGGLIALPDLRNRVAIGAGPANIPNPGDPARAVADKGGVTSVRLLSSQSGVPAHPHAIGTLKVNDKAAFNTTGVGDHSHGYNDRVGAANRGNSFGFGGGEAAAYLNHVHASAYTATGGAGAHAHTVPIHGHSLAGTVANNAAADAAAGHENMPPYYVVNHIIRAL